jgi:hypothetical protein
MSVVVTACFGSLGNGKPNAVLSKDAQVNTETKVARYTYLSSLSNTTNRSKARTATVKGLPTIEPYKLAKKLKDSFTNQKRA